MHKPDAILVDDDILVHMTWQFKAKAVGKTVVVFANEIELLAQLSNFDSSTPIYFDSDLGGGTKGEIVAKKVYEMGYKELYLATGREPEDFDNLYWIKQIRGKEPPF